MRGDLAELRWYRTAAPARDVDGVGPTFVLVHGVGLSHRSYSRLGAALAPVGRVLALDLPGHGHAPAAHRRVPVEELAAAVAAGIGARRRGRGPVVFVGHSMGAEVATEVAARQPDLVQGLALVGPVVDTTATTFVGQAARLLRSTVQERRLTAVMSARDSLRCGPVSYASGVRAMLRYSTFERLRGLVVPLLVVRGTRDPIAPRRWADRLAAQVAGSSVVHVPGAVHDVVHSHPAAVGRALDDFARRLDPA